MKVSLIIGIVTCFLVTGCSHSPECVDGINKLPMYGGVKKCDAQKEADKQFLAYCDKTFKNRSNAAAHMILRGWDNLYKNEQDTAMLRFNQAWLLDSLNAEVYWGFADLLGAKGKYKESLPLYERSKKMNPKNAKLWQDESTSYGNLYFQTRDKKYHDATINSLQKAISLEPKNAIFYSQLTAAYCHFMQKDSARKYMKITEQLDPRAVTPEIRRFLDK